MLESALYIVATPIGNLGDITRRAVDVLSTATVVAAEDTRHSGQLLKHEGIDSKLLAYHEHSAASVTSQLVDIIVSGGSVALISDAGTPTISDPGYRLVRAVQEAGARVIPVPGACAAIAALSATGLPSDRFLFEGFLPAKKEARRSRLQALGAIDATLIIYESPHRLAASLADMVEVLGADREAALARELTKTFETIRRAELSTLQAWVEEDSNQSRGELVVLVAPAAKTEVVLDPPLARLLTELAQHMPARQAAKAIAAYSGLNSRALYDYITRTRS